MQQSPIKAEKMESKFEEKVDAEKIEKPKGVFYYHNSFGYDKGMNVFGITNNNSITTKFTFWNATKLIPTIDQNEKNFKLESINTKKCNIKYHDTFLCPITHQIMMKPVIASDGNSYEKEAIEEWLISSDLSPMEGRKLENKGLIPNNSLKSQIQECFQKHPELRFSDEVYREKESDEHIKYMLMNMNTESFKVKIKWDLDPRYLTDIIINGYSVLRIICHMGNIALFKTVIVALKGDLSQVYEVKNGTPEILYLEAILSNAALAEELERIFKYTDLDYFNIMKSVLRRGSNCIYKDNIFQYICDRNKSVVKIADEDGNGIAHFLAAWNNRNIISAAIAWKIDWDQKNKANQTPIDVAISRADFQFADFIKWEQIRQGLTNHSLKFLYDKVAESEKKVAESEKKVAESEKKVAESEKKVDDCYKWNVGQLRINAELRSVIQEQNQKIAQLMEYCNLNPKNQPKDDEIQMFVDFGNGDRQYVPLNRCEINDFPAVPIDQNKKKNKKNKKR